MMQDSLTSCVAIDSPFRWPVEFVDEITGGTFFDSAGTPARLLVLPQPHSQRPVGRERAGIPETRFVAKAEAAAPGRG
jgi:hypothetical protein